MLQSQELQSSVGRDLKDILDPSLSLLAAFLHLQPCCITLGMLFHVCLKITKKSMKNRKHSCGLAAHAVVQVVKPSCGMGMCTQECCDGSVTASLRLHGLQVTFCESTL